MSDQFTNDRESQEHEERMLRNNLATNAPPVPDWFAPVISECPDPPKRISIDRGGELDRVIDNWLLDGFECSLSECLHDRGLSEYEHALVSDYELERESWQDAFNQWELERERQRLAQWPWEYARLVMDARSVLHDREATMPSTQTSRREIGDIPTNKLESLIGVQDLADRLGVSTYAIYRWCHHQSIPYYRMGRKSLFDPQEIEKWLERKKVGGSSDAST